MVEDSYAVMRQSRYDSDADGIVDRATDHTDILTISVIVGSGGVLDRQVVWFSSSGFILPANAAEVSQTGLVIGMTMEAGDEGEEVLVLSKGAISKDTWNLTPGVIYYLRAGGEISATPPTHGFCQKIGIGKTDKILMLNLGEAIILA